MSKNPRIRPLDDHVINQIAAGEVVERPASIVKELVENSLDAGATRITIELDEGGIERILLRDDGNGIPADQLDLALSRHCTSKLVESSELQSIASLGFRGEALATIAAVGELSCISRTAADSHGWRTDAQPGRDLTRPTPEAHPIGTTIVVRDLFANVPARRRFLKQPRTEYLHCQQFVRRAGFCYPGVSFTLFHDGRQTLSLPGCEDGRAGSRRWQSLFGADFMRAARPLTADLDALSVTGWVGESSYSRQGSDLQYVAVNRRIVRDRHIAHAVRMAYDGMIAPGRHPAYAVHLTLPSSDVDVNVHPGKAEVRFRDPRTIHDVVYSCVNRALAARDEIHNVGDLYPPVLEESAIRTVAEPSTVAFNRTHHQRPNHSRPPIHPSDQRNNLLSVAYHRFALIERDGTLTILDAHGAISALVGARLARREIGSKPLIIPETYKTSITKDDLQSFQSWGVEFGQLNPDTVALRAIPVVVNDVDTNQFGRDVLANRQATDYLPEAIARAAASAFRAPAGLTERRQWYAALCERLIEIDVDIETFCVDLETADLAKLFAGQAH
jgi:DNA mismatch repair protein MutL